ncbi:MAG: CBS domain-containing protein [Phaeodactylibacter sp.]|nr:CBS domain-containing protein [Phaeodactylibacter sp.]MCB9272859.1 CBS domain-containing protein [Lewinellaceae bacterium]
MTAENLISDTVVPLRTSDTGEDALGMMNDFYIRHLPIVNDKQFLGLISEDDILNHDVEEAVGSYKLSLAHAYAKGSDHIYEVLRLLAQHNLTVIPVVDNENNYLGLITLEDLMMLFAKTASFAEPGSILVLEINKRDYSMAEIARIVESEGATILSSFLTSNVDSSLIEVTLKVNRQNLQSIIATFGRFKYIVKASFNETEYVDSLRERFDALMSYLNV